MNSAPSKNVMTSKTNQLGLAVVLLAAFNVYQDYSGGGLPAVQETDVALLISGIGVIINRIKDKHGRKLHILKNKIQTL